MTIKTLSKDTIAELTLKEADSALSQRQKELAEVFSEAGDGQGGYNFNNVKCLGDQVKGSVAVSEAVKQMNQEMDAVGEAIDTLRGAEQAAKAHSEREKGRRNFPLPGGGGAGGKGNYSSESERFKSLGQMIGESKSYQNWAANGAAQGVTLNFDELLPSDFLSKAVPYPTMSTKALMTTAAGYAPEVLRAPGFVEAVTRPLQLGDIIPLFPTSQAAYAYMEETTRLHAAAFTPEGAAFAESTFIFTLRSSPVQKITDSIPLTDEQLEDVGMIEPYIDARLSFGVRQRFDSACLIGDGLGANLRGLKNVVGIQAQAKGADPIPDAFFKAMTKIRLVGRSVPTHHVMHLTDWQNLRLTRDANGQYILGAPGDAIVPRLWGMPIVEQDSDAVGIGYVGAFTPDCVSAFERRGVDVQIGYVNNQFAQGQRTARADARMALVWRRPVAFCSVTGL